MSDLVEFLVPLGSAVVAIVAVIAPSSHMTVYLFSAYLLFIAAREVREIKKNQHMERIINQLGLHVNKTRAQGCAQDSSPSCSASSSSPSSS